MGVARVNFIGFAKLILTKFIQKLPLSFFYRNVEALCCNINLIAAKLIFELKNNTNDDVIVQFIGVFNDILQFGKLNPNEFPITLKKGNNIARIAQTKNSAFTQILLNLYCFRR